MRATASAVAQLLSATATHWYKCGWCGVVVLDAADCGSGQVCNAVLPLCVTTVLASILGVKCSGVRSCGAVCLDVDVCVWMPVCACVLRCVAVSVGVL
jgi:hypothetical protein